MEQLALDVLVGLLWSLALIVGTQLFKEAAPDKFLQYRKWVAVTLIAVSGVVNVIQYLALNVIVVPNAFALVSTIINLFVVGAGVGASAVGLYEGLKDTQLPFRSVNEVLVSKSAETGVIEVVEVHTTEPVQTDVTVKATEVIYEDKQPSTDVKVVEVETTKSVEKKIKKNKKGN